MTVPDSHAPRERDYGPRRLVVELTNVCNLRCGYCLRDEDALYHTPANFFPVELLRRTLRDAREQAGASFVMFTGGETTIHPQFAEVLAAVAGAGMRCSFVTNGWHFERAWPAVSEHRACVDNVTLSLDGATREAHDRWRGEGSFARVVRAAARCHAAGLPFVFKVGIRRDTVPQLEQLALFAARLGAASLSLGHLLPTSGAHEQELALDAFARDDAEREIAALAEIFRMKIAIEVGYRNADPEPPCAALSGASFNVDYRGRLTLCCSLSGYRGAAGDADVVADLNTEGFASAYARLRGVAESQLERRRVALAAPGADDLYTASPCLFCLKTFGKIPWRAGAAAGPRALPVVSVER